MRANPATSIILTAVMLLPGGGRAQGTRVAEAEATAGPTSVVPEPWMKTDLPSSTRGRLAAAFSMAAARLRDNSDCRRLFETLRADGEEVLSQTLYFGTTVREEKRYCGRTSAFTSVGGRITRVCRSFGRLSESRAAVVLIHEALHQAGMSEKPLDSKALDSAQINELVSDSCSL